MKREDIETAVFLSLPFVTFVVFFLLRLTGVIHWSWWWVTAPLWIVVAMGLALVSIYVTLLGLRYRRVNRR